MKLPLRPSSICARVARGTAFLLPLFLPACLLAAERQPWTTSRIKGSPEPPPPFVSQPAFPNLKFKDPLEFVAMPGTDRLIVLEQYGKAFSFRNTPSAEKPDLFADIKKLYPEMTESYSLAFHPQFESNRFVFIWYILQHERPDGTHISRFKVLQTDPPRIDPASEKIIFTWKSGGHNGGAIRFGNDGYLYIGTGDGVGPTPPDDLNTGQDISDLLSSILRIDVDREENGRSYRVPPDNPFVTTPGARPEVWAYGFRNPWRMSFDKETGALWAGDVGWELWEMIYRVEKGGNYGWSVMEGTQQQVRRELKPGPTPILPPVVEHPHSEAASITGGIVYRGKLLPELRGSYIYGDYETGKIWELLTEGERIVRHREIATTHHKISSFGEDADRELYIVDHTGGTLHRLVKNSAATAPELFPRKLTETGLFSDIGQLAPAPGVLRYAVQAEMWKDHAKATRFAGWPGDATAKIVEGKLVYPQDAVLALTYSMEMVAGKPESRRQIETQILHYTEGRWNPYTYEWNDEQTEATLVGANGSQKKLEIIDPSAPGGKRLQNWRLHSRAECLRCHNPWCGTTLAFSGEQLETETWKVLVDSSPPERKGERLVNPHESSGELQARARSWLHINCSHCHRENAGGSVLSFMNIEMRLDRSGLIGRKPAQGMFGIPEAEVIAAGDPARSVLYYRISKTGSGHMPYMGSSLVDVQGIELLRAWIQSMKGTSDFRRTTEAEQKLKAAVGSPSPAAFMALLANSADALVLMRGLDTGEVPAPLREPIIRKAASSPNSSIRDLFQRFLPDSERIETLGQNIDPAAILAVRGDAGRGRALFFEERTQCAACHRINNEGKDFGPDLSTIEKKYSRSDLLEHILQPSKVIAPEFVAYSIDTADDASHTGFIKSRSDREIILRAQTGEAHLTLTGKEKVERLMLSLMPEGLLQSFTVQEAADLLEYLASPKLR